MRTSQRLVNQKEGVGGRGEEWQVLERSYAKRRVQSDSQGALGFCYILRLAVSTGTVDCGGLILKEKWEKRESEKILSSADYTETSLASQ